MALVRPDQATTMLVWAYPSVARGGARVADGDHHRARRRVCCSDPGAYGFTCTAAWAEHRRVADRCAASSAGPCDALSHAYARSDEHRAAHARPDPDRHSYGDANSGSGPKPSLWAEPVALACTGRRRGRSGRGKK